MAGLSVRSYNLSCNQRNRRITHNSIFAFSHSDFLHSQTHTATWRRVIRAKLSKEHDRVAGSAGHPLRITSSTSLTISKPGRTGPLLRARINLTAFAFVVNRKVSTFFADRVGRFRFDSPRSNFNRVFRFSTGSYLLSTLCHRQLESFNFLRFRLSPFHRRVAQIERVHILRFNRRSSTDFFQFSVSVLRSKDRRLGPSFLRSSARFQRDHTLPSDREASTDFLKFSVSRALLRRVGFSVSSFRKRLSVRVDRTVDLSPKNVNRKSYFLADSHHPAFRVRWRVGTIRVSEVPRWSTRFVTLSSFSL